MNVKLTLEEQNKIWELLSEESKIKILEQYHKLKNDTWNGNCDSRYNGEIKILEDTYGYHNLCFKYPTIEQVLKSTKLVNNKKELRTASKLN